MRPAWVQVQVHPTLAESYRLYSLSKNLMEKEENGTGKCFSSSCVCLPRWRVNYQKSPSPSRNKWRERLVKRCRAPEERSSAWKQRVVVEKDVGSRPHIRGQKQRRIWGPGERHHPSLPSFTLQGGPCHHPSVPPFQSPASAPPEGLSPTFTSNSASVPWLRGPHQTPGRLHSPWSAGEEVEQGQLGNWTIVLPTPGPGQAPLYSPPMTTLTPVFMSWSDQLDTDVWRGFVTCPRLDSKQRGTRPKSAAAWPRGAHATAPSGPAERWFPCTTAHSLGAIELTIYAEGRAGRWACSGSGSEQGLLGKCPPGSTA